MFQKDDRAAHAHVHSVSTGSTDSSASHSNLSGPIPWGTCIPEKEIGEEGEGYKEEMKEGKKDKVGEVKRDEDKERGRGVGVGIGGGAEGREIDKKEEKDRHKDREKDKERDRGKSKDKDKDKEKEKDRDRVKDRDRDREGVMIKEIKEIKETRSERGGGVGTIMRSQGDTHTEGTTKVPISITPTYI